MNPKMSLTLAVSLCLASIAASIAMGFAAFGHLYDVLTRR